MSELDEARRRALLSIVRRGGQVIVTATDLRYFSPEELDEATVIELTQGGRSLMATPEDFKRVGDLLGDFCEAAAVAHPGVGAARGGRGEPWARPWAGRPGTWPSSRRRLAGDNGAGGSRQRLTGTTKGGKAGGEHVIERVGEHSSVHGRGPDQSLEPTLGSPGLCSASCSATRGGRSADAERPPPQTGRQEGETRQ